MDNGVNRGVGAPRAASARQEEGSKPARLAQQHAEEVGEHVGMGGAAEVADADRRRVGDQGEVAVQPPGSSDPDETPPARS